MTPDQAGAGGWCELEALAKAHRQLKARTVMELMIAAQGDEKSWKDQMRRLGKIVNE